MPPCKGRNRPTARGLRLHYSRRSPFRQEENDRQKERGTAMRQATKMSRLTGMLEKAFRLLNEAKPETPIITMFPPRPCPLHHRERPENSQRRKARDQHCQWNARPADQRDRRFAPTRNGTHMERHRSERSGLQPGWAVSQPPFRAGSRDVKSDLVFQLRLLCAVDAVEHLLNVAEGNVYLMSGDLHLISGGA